MDSLIGRYQLAGCPGWNRGCTWWQSSHGGGGVEMLPAAIEYSSCVCATTTHRPFSEVRRIRLPGSLHGSLRMEVRLVRMVVVLYSSAGAGA